MSVAHWLFCDPGCGTASTVEDVFGDAVIDGADGYRPCCRDRVVALLVPEARAGVASWPSHANRRRAYRVRLADCRRGRLIVRVASHGLRKRAL